MLQYASSLTFAFLLLWLVCKLSASFLEYMHLVWESEVRQILCVHNNLTITIDYIFSLVNMHYILPTTLSILHLSLMNNHYIMGATLRPLHLPRLIGPSLNPSSSYNLPLMGTYATKWNKSSSFCGILPSNSNICCLKKNNDAGDTNVLRKTWFRNDG